MSYECLHTQVYTFLFCPVMTQKQKVPLPRVMRSISSGEIQLDVVRVS